MGQAIGLTDQLLRDIHVGDLLTDVNGVEYTVDRYGRALPVQGGNEVPIRKLKGCEVKLAWTPAPEPVEPASEPESWPLSLARSESARRSANSRRLLMLALTWSTARATASIPKTAMKMIFSGCIYYLSTTTINCFSISQYS